jgi:hypothetical protein
MTKAFSFQVQRIAGSGELIPVGKPVVIENDYEDRAQQLAAESKLQQRHKKPSSYHTFLETQADRSISYLNEHMPYQWFIVEGKTTWH